MLGVLKKHVRASAKLILSSLIETKTVQANGMTITGSFKDYGLLKAIARGGRESFMLKVFQAVLKPGMVVADVGAHIGHLSLIAARSVVKETGGFVYSFEVNPRNQEFLKQNIRQNNLEGSIRVVPFAISNVAGEVVTIYCDDLQSDFTSMYGGQSGSQKAITVNTETLDRFFFESENKLPAVIKIDIEGAEPLALMGMSRLLGLVADRKPILFIESNEEALVKGGSSSAALVAQLQRFELDVFKVDEESEHLVLLGKGQGLSGVNNLVAATKERLGVFPSELFR